MNDITNSPNNFATAFDRAASRLRAAVTAACDSAEPGPAGVAAAIAATLDFAAADPAAARMLVIEPWAQGEGGTARHGGLVEHFAELLGVSCRRPGGERQPPPLTEQLMVGAVTGVLTEHLLDGRTAVLPSLAPELAELVLLPYVGAAPAKVWGQQLRRQRT